MKRLATPLLLTLLITSFAVGWRAPSASPPERLAHPVNMTLANNTLYVSDEATGVHVYDVADPAAPKTVITIPLRHNRGTAVKDSIIFANDYDALVALKLVGDSYEVVDRLERDHGDPPPWEGDIVSGDRGFGCSACSEDVAYAPSPAGGGSSYATFAVIDDYLYQVVHNSLVVYDVSRPDTLKEISRKFIGWSIETIHPTDAYLFIGGSRGMYIFDRSDPASPVQLSLLEHVRACDPVVVSGSVAYVTLRGSNECGQTPDVLLTVNIEDPKNPAVVGETPLATPHGLVVRDPFLYVSTGGSGYTLLDVAQPTEPSPLEEWTDWPTKDFIWSDSTLFVLGFDDLRIYDVSDPAQPVLLATIEPETI